MIRGADLFSPLLAEARSLVEPLRRAGRDQYEEEVVATVLEEVRRFCSQQVNSRSIDEQGRIPPGVLNGLAERGWFGLTVPERYGGAGLSLGAACRVVTELASYDGSVATCVGLHSGLALYPLIHLASEQLKERYLPEVASGQRIASFAATEPGAGSDLAAMQTTLTAIDGKLVLNGSKCYVTNGGYCGLLTTVARSPGLGDARAGHALVVLDPDWPGVVRQAEEQKLGLKGSSTISIDYQGVVVPPDHVIGDLSLGLEYTHRALTWGRTFMAAGCLGPAQAAISQAEEYVRSRVQFGRPLIHFPLVRHRLAGAHADAYAIESVIRLVCCEFDLGLRDIGLSSTVAKLCASEGAWQIVDGCLQLLGGLGYMEPAQMARRLRDLRVTRIFEGANEVLELHLASTTLGWQPSPDLDSLTGLGPPGVRHPAQTVGALVSRVLEVVGQVRKSYGFRLFEHQLVQSELARALVATYAALACCLRALGATGPSEQERREVARANLAIERCRRRAEAALGSVLEAPEKAERVLVDAVLE